MSQLTQDISRRYKVDNQDIRVEQPVDASTTIYGGSAVGLNAATSYSRQLVGGDVFLGFADAQTANVANPAYPNLTINGTTLGAAGALTVDCRAAGVLVVPLSSVAASQGVINVSDNVYMSDGNTLTLGLYTQTLTVTGSPTGGTVTYSVTAGNETTTSATVAYNATAAVLAAALQALSNVGAGGVTVTGSAGGPYTVVWQGFNPTVAIGTNALTGGTTPSVTIGSTAIQTGISKIGTIQSYNPGLGILEVNFKSPVRA